MLALILQTLALLTIAYIAGCALACGVRRAFYRERAVPVPAERRVDPLPGAAAGHFGGPVARPAAAPPPPPKAAAPVAPPVTAAAVVDDLQDIRAIDAALAKALNTKGVTGFAEIAAWMRGDVQRISQALGLKDRVTRENWIEQAQILAKGGQTAYAKARAGGAPVLHAPTPDEGKGKPAVSIAIATPPEPVSTPEVSERAAFARNVATPDATAASLSPAVPVHPQPVPARDNLQRISGVSADIEQELVAEGFSRYAQIAAWSPSDVARFDAVFGPGRIARENWIEQAQILSRGGDTAYSRDYDRRGGVAAPPAPPAAASLHRSDLSAMRSVRSEAYRPPEPGAEPAGTVGALNRLPGAPDDLKRIRGIGVLIEKKLNAMGISTYEQIANWSAEDIARVSQSMDFKGRIERENWVEQARILASGGVTEFSGRVDRGEVETSRTR